MSTFANVKAELLALCHSPGDAGIMADAMVMALRGFRGEPTEWGQGSFEFVTEAGIREYPAGSYPRLPGGIMSFATTPHVSHSSLTSAVLQPDTLVSSTNLTGVIAALQDSAEKPDGTWLDPASAANTDFVVRWDVALDRALLPGTDFDPKTGVERGQLMRVAMFGEGTDRIVSWEVKESGVSVATGTWTVNSTAPVSYEAKWDAALLSTLSPATNTITLTITDATSAGEVHFGAVQWFTWTEMDLNAVTGGTFPMEILRQQSLRIRSGGRVETSEAQPSKIAHFNDRLWLFPTPNGAYYIYGDYLRDATRDETTNALITDTATTETNAWFRDGKQQLMATTLAKYYALRPHDPKAAALAAAVAHDARVENALAFEQGVFNGPPRSYL